MRRRVRRRRRLTWPVTFGFRHVGTVKTAARLVFSASANYSSSFLGFYGALGLSVKGERFIGIITNEPLVYLCFLKYGLLLWFCINDVPTRND